MEPKVLENVRICLRAKKIQPPRQEDIEEVVGVLSENYHGYAQMVNLLRDWHCFLGDEPKEVDREIRGTLKSVIVSNFDPDKFSSVFQSSGPPAWVDAMVQDKEWRDLLYELAEKYPKRKVLEYAVERCKETVGLEALKEQAQKAGTETASSNLEIFDDKLKHALTDMFKSDDLDASLGRFTDLACHNEHAFVYVLSLLEAVAKKRRLSDGSAVGAGGGGGGIEGDVNEERVATGGDSAEEDVSRLCEEVRQEAVKRGKGKQAEALYNGMTGANQYPEAAVLSLLALLAQKKKYKY